MASVDPEVYDKCQEKSGDLDADAQNITKSTPWRNFIKDDPDERGIPVVIQVCLVDMNSVLKDAELARIGDELKEHQKVIEQQVSKIDSLRARRAAEQTLKFPKTVLDTLFDEMTIISISPVGVFDVGRIGQEYAPGGTQSLHYSVGGGLRLTLASSVGFQIGYARNLHRQPWEGSGAWFAGIQFIDLFGK